MMKFLLLLLFALLLFSCEKEYKTTGNDEEKLDPYIVENYSEDAKQLYFHEIYTDSTHTNYTNPILDKNEINEVLGIIQAVYNSDSPERDTVFDVYQIHGYYCYGFSSIFMRVNTKRDEIKNLANNVIPTGEPTLDYLLDLYNFDLVETSYSYPEFPWLSICTDNEYNMIPIVKEFSNIESIQSVEFNHGCIGGGNTISLKRYNDSATIIFSIGSGDCPVGCGYYKYWEFKVSNGIAEFVKTY